MEVAPQGCLHITNQETNKWQIWILRESRPPNFERKSDDEQISRWADADINIDADADANTDADAYAVTQAVTLGVTHVAAPQTVIFSKFNAKKLFNL